jgi:hypothetical protein
LPARCAGGILPDADGLGLIADMVSGWLGGKQTHYYAHYLGKASGGWTDGSIAG